VIRGRIVISPERDRTSATSEENSPATTGGWIKSGAETAVRVLPHKEGRAGKTATGKEFSIRRETDRELGGAAYNGEGAINEADRED